MPCNSLDCTYQPRQPPTYFYVTNLQGDVVAILDSNGAAVVGYIYDAWGKLVAGFGSVGSFLGIYNPLRYRGYVYDIETGLYYLQSRYYDPEMGRFINADALVSTGTGLLGNNMFTYCNNDSVNNYDPTGHASWGTNTVVIKNGYSGFYPGSAEYVVKKFNSRRKGTNSATGYQMKIHK